MNAVVNGLFNNPLWRVRRWVIFGLLAGLVVVLWVGKYDNEWLQVVLPNYMNLLEWVLPSWFTLAVLEDSYDKWLVIGQQGDKE